jgi:hypothetical protein
LEPLEDRHLLSAGTDNLTPAILIPLPDRTLDQNSGQTTIDLAPVFRDPDTGDALRYDVSAPVTITDVVARVREGAAKTTEEESSLVDSLREILGTDSAPADATNRIYNGLLYAHTGQDRSLVVAAEHDPARDSISSYMQRMGLTTALEQISYNDKAYYNVVGEKRGVSNPNKVYVIAAHYDSYEILGSTAYRGSPGANANASGVAAMLDLVYALAPYHFDATIRFVALDREEQGLVGSSNYVQSHATDDIQGMISLDRIGYRSSATVTTVNMYDVNGDGAIKSDLIAAFQTQFGNAFRAVDRGASGGSAHVPFENAGYDAVWLAEPEGYTQFHTYQDALESRIIDYSYLTNVTQGVARYLCTQAGLVGRSDLFRATISGDLLTLNVFTGQTGTSTCIVRAIDESGAWIEDSFDVTVRETNDAPVLTPYSPRLTPITEDDVNPAGVTVGSFVGASISDGDAGALQGVAVTSLTGPSSDDTGWQYSVDGGTSWYGIYDPSNGLGDANARLLRAEDLIRFKADGVTTETVTLTYRAWDQTGATAGSQGRTSNVGTPGGSSPYSLDLDTASLYVAAVNDAPVLDASATPALAAIAEDTPGNGSLVKDLIVGMIRDVDADALQGIALTGAVNASGAWQYTIDGSTWSNVGTASEASARLLAADAKTRLRFTPTANFNQTISGAMAPTITFRAWDRSSGSNGGVANVGSGGGVTAFSTASDSASIGVWEVNDTPVRIQGALAEFVIGAAEGAKSLGLGDVAYSVGGGADESGLDVNGQLVGTPQTLTCRVTQLPDSSLGQVVLQAGQVPVTTGTDYTLAELRSMEFKPSGTALGQSVFTFTVTDNGTTHGVSDPKSLVQSVTIRVLSGNTVGLFDPSSSWFYLRNTNSTGTADYQFGYGDPNGDWTAMVGDWNGDANCGVGLYDPATSMFYLTNAYTTGYAEVTFGYGVPQGGWIPLVGDWDGNGSQGVGLYDPDSSTFYLTDTLSTGYAEYTFGYGMPQGGWTPLVGDWDGDGRTGVGLYDPHTSTFYLTNNLSTGVAQYTFGYGVPNAQWQPLVGDWNGDGKAGVGLYDPHGSTFYLTSQLSTGIAEAIYTYGSADNGWKPLVGDWNADKSAGVGLYDQAQSKFYLSNSLLTASCDYVVGFGEPGKACVPVVGTWTPKTQVSAVSALATDQLLASASLEDDPLSMLSSTAARDKAALDTVLADLDLPA